MGPQRSLARLVTAFLVDSDVLIDVLRRHRDFERTADDDYAISVITRAELFSGRSADNVDLQAFLAPYDEIDVDRHIATTAGSISRASQLPIADAVIAATAVTTRRVLLTRNLRHFSRVSDLDARGPNDQ